MWDRKLQKAVNEPVTGRAKEMLRLENKRKVRIPTMRKSRCHFVMRQLRTLAWYKQLSVSAFVVGVTPKCPLHQHESNKCELVGDLVKRELGLSTEV